MNTDTTDTTDTTGAVEAAERRIIRDAMDRLLAGTPIRSDGKLTVKSLAVEADVKRWLLTHRHTDLQDEFRDKIQTHGTTPKAMRALATANDRLTQQLKQAKADLKQSRTENGHYTRIVQVLTLELEQMNAASNRTPTTVTPINRRPRPTNPKP